MVDNRDPLHQCRPVGWRPCLHPVATSSSRRSTRIPARSLAAARELGAEDRGILRQRDTYFRTPQRAAEAARGGAGRRDADPVRPARCGGGAREPLPPHRGRRPRGAARVARRRARHARGRRQGAPPPAVGGREDPSRHRPRASGSFVELEGVAPADSDLQAEHEKVARLREALPDRRRDPSPTPTRTACSAPTRWSRRRPDVMARRTRRTRATTSARRCAPRTARSTPARTSRTPPTRRVSAPRRPRSACSSPPDARRCSRPR